MKEIPIKKHIRYLFAAVIGTLILIGILLQVRHYFYQKLGHVKDAYIHLLAVGIASVYVVYKELEFHNLGGNNVFDPYDLIASIVGLVGTFGLIRKFGFMNTMG